MTCVGLVTAITLLVAAAPDGMTVSARPEPAQVTLGQRFEVVIEVKRNKGERVTLPASLPESAVVARAGEPTRKLVADPADPERVTEEIRVPFVALDLDEVETPKLVLTSPDGEPLEVPGLTVRVSDGAAAPADPEAEPELQKERTHFVYDVADHRPYAVAGTAALAALLYAAVGWLSRRRRFWLRARAEEVVPKEPERPAHELALERLEALLASGLLARGEVPVFVERLMDEVLRDYLEHRYAFAAGARTTRELCEELLTLNAPGIDVAGLRRILEAADMVKFARAEVASDSAHAMAMEVKGLVERTKIARAEVAA